MCSLDDLVSHIAGSRVNDDLDECGDGNDFTIWKRDVVSKCLKEAIAGISSLLPDKFGVPHRVMLAAGECVQTLKCGRFISVIEIGGMTCNELKEKDDDVDERSLDFLSCYVDQCETPDCDGTAVNSLTGYNPGWWAKIPGLPTSFRLKNPPPKDMQATVICAPDIWSMQGSSDLPSQACSELLQPLVDNTLFRMYGIDHRDGNNRQLAQSHFDAYIAFMRLKFAQDASFLEDDTVNQVRKISQ